MDGCYFSVCQTFFLARFFGPRAVLLRLSDGFVLNVFKVAKKADELGVAWGSLLF